MVSNTPYNTSIAHISMTALWLTEVGSQYPCHTPTSMTWFPICHIVPHMPLPQWLSSKTPYCYPYATTSLTQFPIHPIVPHMPLPEWLSSQYTLLYPICHYLNDSVPNIPYCTPHATTSMTQFSIHPIVPHMPLPQWLCSQYPLYNNTPYAASSTTLFQMFPTRSISQYPTHYLNCHYLNDSIRKTPFVPQMLLA